MCRSRVRRSKWIKYWLWKKKKQISQNIVYSQNAPISWQVIHSEDFKELVLEDARNVKGREETDTVDIVDEIRYYISSFVLTYSDMEEANEKLRLIDDLLEELDIEAWTYADVCLYVCEHACVCVCTCVCACVYAHMCTCMPIVGIQYCMFTLERKLSYGLYFWI